MSKQTDILEFDNPDLVRRLCGPGHAHLALIEEAFDVYVEAPGSSVNINGDAASRARAGEIVREIYQRLERGWPCGAGDVRALIKAVGKGKVKAASVDAIIPFPRRAPIVPKTPRQEDFIKMLQDATISFGVGPAGTGKTFLATAYGASLLARGEVARFMACRVGQDALAAEPAYAVELLADLRTKGPGRVSGSAMEIARWREGAETRLYKLARARRREDGAAEVAFWEQRAAEAQGMVLRQAAEGGDAVEGRTVAA